MAILEGAIRYFLYAVANDDCLKVLALCECCFTDVCDGVWYGHGCKSRVLKGTGLDLLYAFRYGNVFETCKARESMGPDGCDIGGNDGVLASTKQLIIEGSDDGIAVVS